MVAYGSYLGQAAATTEPCNGPGPVYTALPWTQVAAGKAFIQGTSTSLQLAGPIKLDVSRLKHGRLRFEQPLFLFFQSLLVLPVEFTERPAPFVSELKLSSHIRTPSL